MIDLVSESFYGCAPGFRYNPKTRSCELVKDMPKQHCREGWRFDKKTNSCVNAVENPCNPGFIYNPNTRTCDLANNQNVKQKMEQKQQCKKGWEHDPISGACVKTQDCKEGYTFNPSMKACVQKVPECKTGYVYNEEKKACDLLTNIPGQSCPVDSDFDPVTGACRPRGKKRPLSVIDQVPSPLYKSMIWRYHDTEPMLFSSDNKMAKTTYGDLMRSSYRGILKNCIDPLPMEFIVTDGVKTIFIDRSKYKLSNLYAVAEEIYGRPILNPRTRRPLPEAIGRELMLRVRYSYEYGDEGPLIIEGRHRVVYVLEPEKSEY